MGKLTYKELEAEVVRLRIQDAESDLGNGVLMEHIATLEAENARLKTEYQHLKVCYDNIWKQALRAITECTEARYYAIHYKQLYNQIHPEYILMKLSLLPDEPDI